MKEEVKELTEVFRNEWKDVQEIASNYGLNLTDDFLLSYIEGDNGNETCLFFSKKKGLFLYEALEGNKSFRSVTEQIGKEFPQVQVLKDIDNFDSW